MMKTLVVAAAALLAFAGQAQARDQIKIVGSSTVFPFSTAVAENFGKGGKFKTPVVESTGTGGGLKLFCAGIGEQHPDITNASRAIKKSEIDDCAKNGIKEITEVKVGFDGIVVANSKASPKTAYSLGQIFKALAKEVVVDGKVVANPAKRWSDVDPALPNKRIEVLGPPPTSGTRDAFNELAMLEGCKQSGMMKQFETALGDAKKAEKACNTVREDGAYVEAGENDVLIVQKLVANKDAYGVFGFSFLEESQDKIQGSLVSGNEPSFENISSGKYPLSRSLFFYVKNAHVASVPGIKEFVTEFTSDKAAGEDGYLEKKGLIPLPKAEREKVRSSSVALQPMPQS